MVRLFTALCKSLFEIISDEDIFNDATDGYSHYGKPCPHCGAIGKLDLYGKYERGFTYLKPGKIIDSRLKPLRFKCKSCDDTHALLPDVVIPYGRYSLRFVLTVLTAYFERTTTVEGICGQFGIAVSTLYEWKKRVILYKDLMLGLLISQKTKTSSFIKNLLNSDNLSELLRCFFLKHGFSFMQKRSRQASKSHPP